MASSKPHPDALKQLLVENDSAKINDHLAAHGADHGMQLALFHLYRSQSDLDLRKRAVDLQERTLPALADKARSGDAAAKSELTTLKGTLKTFVWMSECPPEIKPKLEAILKNVEEATA
jgi:hypothetical protein